MINLGAKRRPLGWNGLNENVYKLSPVLCIGHTLLPISPLKTHYSEIHFDKKWIFGTKFKVAKMK